MTEDTGKRTARLDWPDSYRGMVIVLIVAVHAAKALLPAGFAVEAVAETISDLQFIGMTAFFVISGMNSRKYIDGPARPFWIGRIVPLFYLLLLWALLFPLVTNGARGIMLHPVDGARAILNALINPFGYLWFVWSLLVYSVIARVGMRRAPRLTLAFAAVIVVSALGLDPEFWTRHPLPLFNGASFAMRRALGYLFFFLVGYCYRDDIVRLSRGPLIPVLIPTLLVGLSFPWIAAKLPTNLIGAPMRIIALGASIFGSIYVGRLVARLPAVGRALIWLGRLTLPIYLVHPIIIVVLGGLIARSDIPLFRAMPNLTVWSLTVVAIGVSIAIAAVSRLPALSWLFRTPAPGSDLLRSRKRRAAYSA